MDTGDNRITQAIETLTSSPGLLGGLVSMLGSGAGPSVGSPPAIDPGLLASLPGLITKLKPLLTMFGESFLSKETVVQPVAGTPEEDGGALMRAIASVLGNSGAGTDEGSIPSANTAGISALSGELLSSAVSADGKTVSEENPEREAGADAVFAGAGFPGSGKPQGCDPHGHGSHRHCPEDKRLALLIALKPYLSPRRANAIDAMVRFGRIGELLEGLSPGKGGK